ncbi:hypothetical protein SLNWT_1613 [Streptomyces albus]|uniref:Uncharacterized protein n=1 Tax=Streptomyces albus (strain ATCC 21838 / DSM 41398 / FERM P-419 / JCM 4703 / NBRC 107858) TaxID=1081613 RepID=A0A0B5EKC7_STRA4|nr:hypothetical protein SLNWT_1613 [Streptomyces albus]AOU76306.1 hypothetical protein SLNHY_1615 [Streptomyces albus]AYN32092.1 hypothetical protein DUI70_1589 [Streptomyces albus]
MSTLHPLYRQAASAARRPLTLVPAASRLPGQGQMPSIRAGGWDLSREEAAAALFETSADELELPSLSTGLLSTLLERAVTELGGTGLLEVAETFSTFEVAEFPEADDCRWFAYRLALAAWYTNADARPMTLGEAAAALALSDHDRHAATGTHTGGARMLGWHVRQGAARVPATALVRLGRTLTAALARTAVVRPGSTWLYHQALPDHNRNRRCLDLIRSGRPIPLPMLARTPEGALTLGAVPPPGPGNRWTRSTTEEW